MAKQPSRNQPTVQLGRDLHLDGRPGKFTIWSEGTKVGRYWAFQRRPGMPSIWVEVRRALKEDKATYEFLECRD